jgi:polysaccharide pyruvyl transferase WcaK-like protein
MNREKQYSFAILSPCGFGNLGDAATMEAVIQNVRRRITKARIQGITLWPAETERRHQIPTYPLGAISRPMFVIVWPSNLGGEAPPGDEPGAYGDPDRKQEVPSRLKAGVRFALRSIARILLPADWRWNIRKEVRHVAGAYRLLKEVDMVILSGGGQLDDFWGGAWGQPYALMKWAILSRLAKARFVVLCTGYGVLASPFSRFFARTALACADYLSYRDEGSRQLMRQAGFKGASSVFPDLAFSFEFPQVDDASSASGNLRSVCLSPMAYCHPELWPVKNDAIYRNYIEKLTKVVQLLFARQIEVVMIASDSADNQAIKDLRDALVRQMGEENLGLLRTPAVQSVADFLQHVAQGQLLIASRLHGVVLSHLGGVPSIALAYDRKVKSHMEAANQTAYCLSIDDFDIDELMQVIEALRSAIDGERSVIRAKNREFRLLLDGQYDEILGGRFLV